MAKHALDCMGLQLVIEDITSVKPVECIFVNDPKYFDIQIPLHELVQVHKALSHDLLLHD